MSGPGTGWEQSVLREMRAFSDRYETVYARTDRELSAYFEIGCFLSLVEFYVDSGYRGEVQQPDPETGCYRYLTTPSGNPANFSFMRMESESETIELRQQVRIVSHVGADVAFTPDIVAICENAAIHSRNDEDYANGRRRFFYVRSDEIIAAHECKSLVPFPELLISFLGTVLAAHAWIETCDVEQLVSDEGNHLAPTLFVGGTARPIHLRMIRGLKDAYPLNIVVGMHSGTWDLTGENAHVKRMRNPLLVEFDLPNETSEVIGV